VSPESTQIYSGSTPLGSSSFSQITDWPSCERFLHNDGIDITLNEFNNFNIVIEEVTVFEILIDETGRARETRTFHAFPQPTNYYPEFDLSVQQNAIVDVSSSNSESFGSSSF